MNNIVEENSKIRILSYNIFIRPPGVTANGDDFKDQRLQEFFSKKMVDYDVICLQEIFGSFSSRRDWLIKEANKRGFKYSLYSVKPSFGFCSDFFIVDGGLLILSRFPINECNRMTFSKGKNNDSFASKGVIHTRLFVGGAAEEIDVYNLHLQSLDKHEDERLYQLDMFRAFFEHTHKSHCISFIAGDFNMNGKNESTYTKLLNKMTFDGMVTIDNLRQNENYGNICTYGDPFSDNGCLIDENEKNLDEILDYIWTIIPINNSKITPREGIKIMLKQNTPSEDEDSYVINSVGVDKFQSNNVYKTLSDHYGVYLNVTIKKPEFKFC